MINHEHTEYLQYKFTPEDLRALGQQLAKNHQDAEELKLKKKRVTRDLDSQISGIEESISTLSRKLNEGSEYRDINCAVHMNEPRAGYKTIIRRDTWEVVKIDPMTSSEMQGNLFEEKKDGGAASAAPENTSDGPADPAPSDRSDEPAAADLGGDDPASAEDGTEEPASEPDGNDKPADPADPAPTTWPTADEYGEFPLESAEPVAIYVPAPKDPDGTKAEIRVLQIGESDWVFGVVVHIGQCDMLDLIPYQDTTTDTRALAIREGYIEASRAVLAYRKDLKPRAKDRATCDRIIEWLKNEVKPLCGDDRGMTLAAQALEESEDLDGECGGVLNG